ncbi:hypothetical protein BC939DRAFT_460738 [Gamsiella multidivaricata]|uniref:uncharacterized protein n=1 Tax=Gamsiella multidivaricata TaxID=101098 RepID=UPI00221FB59C|nr:uncharacterized protein BC939DRAFT_460738 [Gamsiella multidivaricata]KAG0369573.1 hypothetical protein BGZ54_009549 [Gamsiella multidivaricata]KAI7819269.1 hypothetical protein BC939DRAFT_460738 [Gamsiella multidivaricata]
MNSEIENKTNRAPAVKVGGMRVPAADHPVPVVRKEYERKVENDEQNEEERQLEKTDQFEQDKMGRIAAGERLARMQENQPKHEPNNNFRQKENIYVNQPILHTHNKSGAAASGQN